MGGVDCLKLIGIAVTVFVNELNALAVAATPVPELLTVLSNAVMLAEFADTVPSIVLTSDCRSVIALAFPAILVSSTAIQLDPSYLYCFLLSSVSNQRSPMF